ncbi:hypothetical protein B0H13DRAFT_2308120 [Mycena leptocephala]|nr:hypothetical protein B0H13DRAFT_2308120 [Mycena leptocephala]
MPFVDLQSADDFASIYYITNSWFSNVGGLNPEKATICILHQTFLDCPRKSVEAAPSRDLCGPRLAAAPQARFPTARRSSGHRLFISAFMITSKVICDHTHSNKSWSIVPQGMLTLCEINQMEREMCNYLDWELTVDDPILGDFEARVQRDIPPNSKGPYPTYSLHMVSKHAAKAAASTSAIPEPSSTTSPIPTLGQKRQVIPMKDASYQTSAPPIIPPSIYKSTSATTPDTPFHSYSNTTSPASSISPPTPTGPVTHTARVHYEMSPSFTISSEVLHPLTSKMFAFAIPAAW